MNTDFDISNAHSKILIVDDDSKSRLLLKTILATCGYILISCGSGEEALELIKKDPPDLILLDVMMPGLDGYQVIEKIKIDPDTKSIPIIIITARDGPNTKLLSLNVGADDFLSKPINREELCLRVRNLLRLKAYGDYFKKYSQMLERLID